MNRLELKEEYAWNFLVDITKQFPGEITLVAIGRMTLIFILEIFDILTASQFENYTIHIILINDLVRNVDDWGKKLTLLKC